MYSPIFKSNLINNMDHMHISSTESSSVILGQTKYFKKVKCDAKKCMDGVINPNSKQLQFQIILKYGKLNTLETLRISRSRQ